MESNEFLNKIIDLINERKNQLAELENKKALVNKSLESLRVLLNTEKVLTGQITVPETINTDLNLTQDKTEDDTYVNVIENILNSYNREMSAPEIHRVMLANAVKINSNNPRNFIYSMLYGYAKRNQRFYKNNLKWGLLKWKFEKVSNMLEKVADSIKTK